MFNQMSQIFLRVFKAEMVEKGRFVKNYALHHGKASKLG